MNESKKKISLLQLPEEVIVMIIKKCDMMSIRNLCLTCRKFKLIVDNDDNIWQGASSNVFGTNMASSYMRKRCNPILTYKKRCIMTRMWHKSIGVMSEIVHFKKCMPWMLLERDYLYLSKGETIVQYERDKNGNISSDPKTQAFPCEDDISKIAVNERELVCAGRDGRLVRLDKKNFSVINSTVAHSSDLLSVDIKNDIIISGCKDSFKIWKTFPRRTECRAEVPLKNRLLSLAIMPSNSYFVVGTPGTKAVHPLQLFDIQSGKHISNFGLNHRYGAGILDIYPETHHTTLTCGYDTTLQLWDTRSPEKSVSVWTEPNDNSLYCVQSDHINTMITGAASHAMFLIWDKRVQNRPVKTYYTPVTDVRERHVGRAWHKGPIFSISFDSTHIFIAIDKMLLQYSYF